MDKFTLRQYERVKKELPEVRRRADRAERELKKMETQIENETVRDVVKGGEGGWQVFHIEGIPYEIPVKQARHILETRKALLDNQIEQCTNLLQLVESYIASIEDSEMRQIIQHRFISGATWANVAARMGYEYTEDMVKKKFERFMATETK